ncbi:MAG: hypothetical protein H8E84_05780 [Flavobacteriales bacterium]|nr:hypothetical protein [Flavobacteriales bacterium]
MKYIILIITIFSSTILFSQSKGLSNTFNHTTLINGQTTEMMAKDSWEFRIQHRFGQVGLDSTLYEEFLGLDMPANIRFAFNYYISDRLYIGIGRTKYNKTFDFEAKYKLLNQTNYGSMPISLAIYSNLTYNSSDQPKAIAPSLFANIVDGDTIPFEYSNAHRIAYNSQIIISRKVNSKLSLQVAHTIIYKNLTVATEDNLTAIMIASGRYKFGLRTSVLFEYAYKLNNVIDNPYNELDNHWSLGYEFATSGHAFQIVMSTSSHLVEQDIYTSKPADFIANKFILGFNIRRTIWK